MKKALGIAQGLLMTFAAFFTVSLIYTIITWGFILITGVEIINPQVDYCLMVMAVMLSSLIFYIWYKKYLSIRLRAQVNLKAVFSIKNIGIYIALGIGCQLFMSGVLSLIRPLFKTLFDYYDETINSIFIGDTLIAAVYVVILAPVIEELMLRGILLNRLRYEIPFYAANLLQATVFGIYHWDIIQGIYAFGIGLILGYIFEKTKTLCAPIFVHMLINGSGFLIQETKIGEYISVWMAVVIGGVLLFTGLFGFIKSTKKDSMEKNDLHYD